MNACALCGQDHAPGPCPSPAAAAPAGTALAPPVADAIRAYLTPPPQDPFLGRLAGNYKLLRVLGRGGMGSVYLAEHPVIGSRVAVKILRSLYSRDPELLARFVAEALAVNLIGHENIVQIHDLNVLDGEHYYCVMEYLESESLGSASARGPMPLREAGPIVLQVADGLAAAHAKGVIHRDLKPDNIYLLPRPGAPMVKIFDFGVAKLRGTASSGATQAGTILGSPHFMAPEQAGGSEVDERADVYSLGVIMYKLATGELPVDAPTFAEILMQHAVKPVTPPREVNPSVPPAYEAVILKALAKSPAERYRNMTELAGAVRGAMQADGHAPAAAAPAPIPTPEDRVEITPARGESKDARHPANLQVTVQVSDAARLRQMYASDVSRGGLFIATDAEAPPVFTTVDVTIAAPGDAGAVTLKAEVVRRVTREEARAWNGKPGFGVQFLDLNAATRRRIEALLETLPPPEPPAARTSDSPHAAARAPQAGPPSVAVPTGADPGRHPHGRAADSNADRLIEEFQTLLSAGHYELLGVPLQADAAAIHAAARTLVDRVDSVQFPSLDTGRRTRLGEIRDRVKTAEAVLVDAAQRAEYDAPRGNFLGVARALASGLGVDELARLRRKFLQVQQQAEETAQHHLRAAVAAERRGDIAQAVEGLTQALRVDPLNFAIHQRYWALKRQQRK